MEESKVPPCTACPYKRQHTAEDWKSHPLAGHGYSREVGWTCEAARVAYEQDEAARVAREKEQEEQQRAARS